MNPIEVLIKSTFDTFRPKMLSLTLTSIALSVVFWLILFWFAFEWGIQWANSFLNSMGFDMTVAVGDELFLLTLLKSILLPLTVFGLLWPIVVGTAVFLAGIYVMPPVIRFLESKHVMGIHRHSEIGISTTVFFAIKVFTKFLVFWLISIPLWFIPGVAFILPVFLTAYMLRTLMRFDALSEHATQKEIAIISKQDDFKTWVIAFICALLSFIPPILLIVPVLSALSFGRYYLNALGQLRQSEVVDVQ